MPTAAIYTRISRDATGESLGVQRQETECRALAARLGLDVSGVYADNDLSAFSGRERPEFERLLAARPDAILAYHQDRLLRLTADLERVIALDVPVYTVSAGTLDLTNAAGRAVARTVAAWSQYESEQKATRQRSANAQAAQAGKPYWRRRPFGWNLDGTLVPDEAKAIQDGCRWLLEGWSLAAITREWIAAGHYTPKSGTMGGNPWTTKGVRRVLMASRIAAIREYDGAEYPGAWEPAVSEDTWRAVCAVLNNPDRGNAPKTGKVAQSLLAGIARCAECGGLMHTDRSRGDRAYRCTERRELLRKADPIDALVLTETARLLTLPGIAEHVIVSDDDDERAALLAERRALVTRRDVEIPEALAQGLSLAQVAAANRTVTERLQAIDAALEATTADASLWAVFEAARTAQEARSAFQEHVWQEMPLEARRAVVRALWHVQVGKDGPTVEPTATALRLADSVGAGDWYREPTD